MRNRRFGLAFIVALCLFGATCSEDSNPNGTGGLCRTGTYQLNPNNGQPYPLTEDYRYLCQDSSFDPDIRSVYESCPDVGGGFFWFTSGGVGIGFQAALGEYRFIGSAVREFGSGVGPFASGAYEKTSGGTTIEVGTFSFTEGDIEFPGTVECMP